MVGITTFQVLLFAVSLLLIIVVVACMSYDSLYI